MRKRALTTHHILRYDVSADGPLHLYGIDFVDDVLMEENCEFLYVFTCAMCSSTRTRFQSQTSPLMFCPKCQEHRFFNLTRAELSPNLDASTIFEAFDYEDGDRLKRMVEEYNRALKYKEYFHEKIRYLNITTNKRRVNVVKKDVSSELLSREEFRDAVFMRDKHSCVICGQLASDAHHIYERRLWEDGGYYVDNGASLCSNCHYKAETTEISVEEIQEAAKITNKLLPSCLAYEGQYDKWGNPYFTDGKRLRGPLFYDENVRKVLVNEDFLPYVKYPRTAHLPWSHPSINQDVVLKNVDHFVGQKVVVTEKLDGQNLTLYRDYMHSRALITEKNPAMSQAKRRWAEIAHNIDVDMRINVENTYVTHSLRHVLPSNLYGFFIWQDDMCLDYDDTREYLEMLDLPAVPLLYRGVFNPSLLQEPRFLDYTRHEGYVVRLDRAFSATEFPKAVAKFVRKDHNKLKW